MELPPRTRRILLWALCGVLPEGTISAHAENTPLGALWRPPGGNYLRVRGEYTPLG